MNTPATQVAAPAPPQSVKFAAPWRPGPPLFRALPAIVMLAIVLADGNQRGDPDLWGHVLFGRQLLAHGALPATNPYSYSAPGYPWLDHAWLSEVLMAWLFNQLGAVGLKLFKFACAAGTICFIAAAESEFAASANAAAAVVLVCALILMPAMQFRPTLFDYLAIAAMTDLFARHNRRGSAPLWLTIPLMALWSNLHGGFIVGLAALGAYGGAVTIQEVAAGRGVRRGLQIIALAAAAAAATLCTLLIAPARENWITVIHAVTNPMTRHITTDWQPLITTVLKMWRRGGAEAQYSAIVTIFLATGVAVVILKPRGGDFPMLAVAAAMMAAAFASFRNIPFPVIALAPVLTNRLGRLIKEYGPSRPPGEDLHRQRVVPRIALQVVIGAAALALAWTSGVLSPGIDASDYPAGAIRFMNRHRLAGNLLAEDAWGGYVIWHEAPNSKVFIDSRMDLAYPPQVLLDYVQLLVGAPGGVHTLAAYPHDFLLFRASSKAVRLINAQPDWELIYSDPVASLYARRGSAAAARPGVPVVARRQQAEFP